jgi:hypothetical protein
VATHMVAPVHLPHGAIVTRFTAYFYDNSSAENMTATLYRQGMTSSYGVLGQVYSSGSSTSYQSALDTTIGYATVDNINYGYHVSAYCNPWVGSALKIKGAVIQYTISGAD